MRRGRGVEERRMKAWEERSEIGDKRWEEQREEMCYG